ncbi:hypothetical protein LJC20_06680 [Eubacteriales bacterium OttesenSCG-928-M02]|nr:hypothetical protein [Eubacteriales bacterium OttesenSCG-928-M02]
MLRAPRSDKAGRPPAESRGKKGGLEVSAACGRRSKLETGEVTSNAGDSEAVRRLPTLGKR